MTMPTQNVPMSGYPWQLGQWRRLVSQHQQGRLAHALLLSGPAGFGKLEFARRFAEYVLCQSPADSACGQCASCHLLSVNNHPDLFLLTPEEIGKAIKIDAVRELILTLNQTAQRAGYQVAVIAPAEAMNKAAANALLKTLEEPMGKVVLLLVSHQPGQLPATIRSRCQQIQFTYAHNADVWLSAQLRDLNSSLAAPVLLKIAEHAPLRALDLAKNNYLTLRDQLLTHLLEHSQGRALLLAPVAGYLQQNLSLWIDAFISIAMDLLRLNLGVNAAALTNQDRLSQLQPLAPLYPFPALPAFLTELYQARQSILSSQIHLNEPLLVESLLIHWEMSRIHI